MRTLLRRGLAALFLVALAHSAYDPQLRTNTIVFASSGT